MIEIRTVGDLAELMSRIREANEDIEATRESGSLIHAAAWERWNVLYGEEVQINPLVLAHA